MLNIKVGNSQNDLKNARCLGHTENSTISELTIDEHNQVTGGFCIPYDIPEGKISFPTGSSPSYEPISIYDAWYVNYP
jgi:hypothetical protein